MGGGESSYREGIRTCRGVQGPLRFYPRDHGRLGSKFRRGSLTVGHTDDTPEAVQCGASTNRKINPTLLLILDLVVGADYCIESDTGRVPE